jgi:hypothetical protein
VLAQDAWLTRVSGDAATATHENTVIAQHPTASRLGRCHLVMRLTKVRDFHNILAQKVHMTLQFSYDP